MQRNLKSILFSRNNDSLPAAIAGFVLIQLLSRHGGIGVTPDSVVYLSTAQNIHDHGLINDFTNSPLMDFPAFYPIFLSGIIFLTGHSVMAFGPILDGLLFALVIWLCGWIMDRFSHPSRWYKHILLLFILLSPCLLEVYSMIWSETLFLLLSILFMIGCHRYFQRYSIRSLLFIAVIAGLACVTRYAGLSVIAMGGLLMVCDGRLRWGARKIGHLLLFGLVAILFPALNLYRNWLVTDTLAGYREKAIRSLAANLHDFGSVLCDWMPFFNERYGWATALAILFILLITGIFVFRLVRKTNFFSYDTIAISYFVSYAFFILFVASVSRFQQLDSRLLSPLCIPWLWGATCWIPGVISSAPRPSDPRVPSSPRKKIWIIVIVLAAACFLYGECNAFQFNWSGIKYAGIPGYTEDTWQQSETMAYVKTHKDSLERAGKIYSSATDGLWFLARVPADLMPHVETTEDIEYMMREDHFTVIWFDDSVNTDLIDVNYIRKRKLLIREIHFGDGAIYFFSTAKPAPPH
jgi:hypothetical protein